MLITISSSQAYSALGDDIKNFLKFANENNATKIYHYYFLLCPESATLSGMKSVLNTRLPLCTLKLNVNEIQR